LEAIPVLNINGFSIYFCTIFDCIPRLSVNISEQLLARYIPAPLDAEHGLTIQILPLPKIGHYYLYLFWK
jgi:hypothetical protein